MTLEVLRSLVAFSLHESKFGASSSLPAKYYHQFSPAMSKSNWVKVFLYITTPLCITTITTLHPLHHYDHYTTPFASLRYEGVYTGEPQLRKGVKGIPLPFTHLIPDNTSQTRECSRTGWYISFIWCCYWDKMKPLFSIRRVKLLSWLVCWKFVFWKVSAHA